MDWLLGDRWSRMLYWLVNEGVIWFKMIGKDCLVGWMDGTVGVWKAVLMGRPVPWWGGVWVDRSVLTRVGCWIHAWIVRACTQYTALHFPSCSHSCNFTRLFALLYIKRECMNMWKHEILTNYWLGSLTGLRLPVRYKCSSVVADIQISV
jgi:hypothetical protein